MRSWKHLNATVPLLRIRPPVAGGAGARAVLAAEAGAVVAARQPQCARAVAGGVARRGGGALGGAPRVLAPPVAPQLARGLARVLAAAGRQEEEEEGGFLCPLTGRTYPNIHHLSAYTLKRQVGPSPGQTCILAPGVQFFCKKVKTHWKLPL